jgi:hypothetical protein
MIFQQKVFQLLQSADQLLPSPVEKIFNQASKPGIPLSRILPSELAVVLSRIGTRSFNQNMDPFKAKKQGYGVLSDLTRSTSAKSSLAELSRRGWAGSASSLNGGNSAARIKFPAGNA